MQPLSEFVTKWNGEYCEVAGSANAQNQCVDLANAWIRDGLGLPIIEWTNAIDFPSKAGDKYEWIVNTKEAIAIPGDIAIFGKPYGLYIDGSVARYAGHIAVVTAGSLDSVTIFEQNNPIKSPCHLHTINYSNILGWLRPKVSLMSTLPANYGDIIHNSTQWEEVCKTLELGEAKSTLSQAVVNTIGGYKSRITTLEKQAGENQAEIANRIEEVSRVKKEVLRAVEQQKLATDQAKTIQDELTAMSIAKGQINIELEQVKKANETLQQRLDSDSITVTWGMLLKLLLNQKVTIKKE